MERLGVKLIVALTVLLTLTVIIAGVIVYKTSGDQVKKKVAGYIGVAASMVETDIGRGASLEEIKNSLLSLQAKVSGSLWIIDEKGEIIISLNPNYEEKERFGDEIITISSIVTEEKYIKSLDRKKIKSSLFLKNIFNEEFNRGIGTYNPKGLGTKVLVFHVLKDKKWLIGADVPLASAYSEVNNIRTNVFRLCILIFIVTIVFTSIAVKKIIKPYYKEEYNLRKNVEINNDKLRQLYELNNVMQQRLSSRDRYYLISKNILDLLQIDRVNLFLLSDDKKSLECDTLKEDISGEMVTIKIPISDDGGIIAKSFNEKSISSFNTIEKQLPADLMISRELMQGTDLLSGVFVILPIVLKEKCIGVAIADNHLSKKDITNETVDFLKLVMSQAAVTLENIDLYQKLKDYAIELETTDHLTGIFNFSHFKKMLELGIKDCIDNNIPLTLGIIYINNFSEFNEKNGHPAGDLALRQIASILDESLQEGDIVGRCYGSKFGIIFRNKDEKESLYEINKIKNNIQNTFFDGLEKLEEKMFTSKSAVRYYKNEDNMSCDEFFKKLEDTVKSST